MAGSLRSFADPRTTPHATSMNTTGTVRPVTSTETELRRASDRNVLSRRLRRGAVRALDWCERRAFPETASASEHYLRVKMDQAVGEYLDELGSEQLDAAEISGSAHAERTWASFQSLNYPDFDLCAPLVVEGQFDVVICEQVLEHVADPSAAAANLLGLVRPGGHVIVTTPFLVRIHELLEYGMYDYWRFTPRGLGVLLERAGLDVVDVGSWGNRVCVQANLSRWSAYRSWQPLRNEPDVPLQVWAIARRPPEGVARDVRDQSVLP